MRSMRSELLRLWGRRSTLKTSRISIFCNNLEQSCQVCKKIITETNKVQLTCEKWLTGEIKLYPIRKMRRLLGRSRANQMNGHWCTMISFIRKSDTWKSQKGRIVPIFWRVRLRIGSWWNRMAMIIVGREAISREISWSKAAILRWTLLILQILEAIRLSSCLKVRQFSILIWQKMSAKLEKNPFSKTNEKRKTEQTYQMIATKSYFSSHQLRVFLQNWT